MWLNGFKPYSTRQFRMFWFEKITEDNQFHFPMRYSQNLKSNFEKPKWLQSYSSLCFILRTHGIRWASYKGYNLTLFSSLRPTLLISTFHKNEASGLRHLHSTHTLYSPIAAAIPKRATHGLSTPQSSEISKLFWRNLTKLTSSSHSSEESNLGNWAFSSKRFIFADIGFLDLFLANSSETFVTRRQRPSYFNNWIMNFYHLR